MLRRDAVESWNGDVAAAQRQEPVARRAANVDEQPTVARQ
jgi:hypothetical protein